MSTEIKLPPSPTTPSNGSQKNPPTAAKAVETPPKKEAETATSSLSSSKTDLSSAIIAVLVYAFIGLGVAWYYWGREAIQKNWFYIAGGVLAVLVIASLPATRRRYAQATAQWRIGATLLISTTATLAFIVFVFLFEPDTQAAFLRLVFIMVVCSLPAVMYYLFIATKKYSLLNEFIMNLGRLGLLYPSRVPQSLVCAGLKGETEGQRRKRVKTYLQKFESVYGKVPTNLSTFVLKPTETSKDDDDDGYDGDDGKTDGSGFSDIFTFDTTLPVLIATLLIALGWLITLPPWDGRLNLFNRAQTEQLATAIETQSNKAGIDPTQAQTAQAQTAQAATGQQAEGGKEAKPEEKVDRWLGVFSPVQSPVRFAFIGAYFFGLQLLFRRYVRRDLRASAYVSISLRIILAMIGIWVVSAAVKIAPNDWLVNKDGGHVMSDNTLLVLGFVIGVFPRVAWQVVETILKRTASVVLPSLRTQLPVSDLDGLTVWHEARFEEEDIENIPNMATADIVDLMISTRVPPDRIIDWVDQAILYTHLGPESEKSTNARVILRSHGIRTASALVEDYNLSELHADRDAFENIIPAGDGRKYMRSLVDAVGTNPNLKLIQTWRGLLPHTHDGPAPNPNETKPEANAAKPESANAATQGASFVTPGPAAQGQTTAAAGNGHVPVREQKSSDEPKPMPEDRPEPTLAGGQESTEEQEPDAVEDKKEEPDTVTSEDAPANKPEEDAALNEPEVAEARPVVRKSAWATIHA